MNSCFRSSQVHRLIPPKNVLYMVLESGSNIWIMAQAYALIFCSGVFPRRGFGGPIDRPREIQLVASEDATEKGGAQRMSIGKNDETAVPITPRELRIRVSLHKGYRKAPGGRACDVQLANFSQVLLRRGCSGLFVAGFEIAVAAREDVPAGEIKHPIIQLEQFAAGGLNQWTLSPHDRLGKGVLALDHAHYKGRQIDSGKDRVSHPFPGRVHAVATRQIQGGLVLKEQWIAREPLIFDCLQSGGKLGDGKAIGVGGAVCAGVDNPDPIIACRA